MSVIMMIYNCLCNALILDAPVMVQELCIRLLSTSTGFFCAPDRIQLVCPVQLILWTFAGGTFHCSAESCCSNLQPIQADYVPESLSKSDQLVGPAVVFCVFAQLVALSYMISCMIS